MIRLLLADDQELVRTGFRMVLDAQSDMTVAAEVANGAEAVAAVSQAPAAYDVVLMDVRMPVVDGLEATRRIVASGAPAKVLVLTTFDIDEYVFAALQAGASGFLLKDAGPDELLAAVRAVHNGDAVVAPSATKRLPASPQSTGAGERLDALTEREVEVLTAVARGLTNAEIAATLYLAEATVKTHIGHVLAKLGLRDRVHMVLVAYNAGLVRPDPYA